MSNNIEEKTVSSQDANARYQKDLERIIASLIRKYDWLDSKSEMYSDDIALYIKLVDALTKVSAHIRDFLRMAGVRIETDDDLAILLARIKDDVNAKRE